MTGRPQCNHSLRSTRRQALRCRSKPGCAEPEQQWTHTALLQDPFAYCHSGVTVGMSADGSGPADDGKLQSKEQPESINNCPCHCSSQNYKLSHLPIVPQQTGAEQSLYNAHERENLGQVASQV